MKKSLPGFFGLLLCCLMGISSFAQSNPNKLMYSNVSESNSDTNLNRISMIGNSKNWQNTSIQNANTIQSELFKVLNQSENSWTNTSNFNQLDCSINYPGSFADGIGSIVNIFIAEDFSVPANTNMSINRVKIRTYNSFYYSDIYIFRDNAGFPGTLVGYATSIVPTSQIEVGSYSGFILYENTLDLPTPIEAVSGESESLYWVALKVYNPDMVYWEIADQPNHNSMRLSYDGINWSSNSNHLAVQIFGDCNEAIESEGCLDAYYGIYPNYTIDINCNGVPTSLVNGIGYYGEYSMVNVTAGTEYIFSSNDPTAYITISNQTGTTVYGYGTGSVTWTATANEVVRMYTHLNSVCGSSESFVDRWVQCGSPISINVPDFPCYQGDGLASNLFETGYQINNGRNGADDFIVEPGKVFHVQQVRLNVFANGTITTSNLRFRADNNGKPGAIIESVSMAPTSTRTIGSNFGYDIQELTFDLPNTFDFTEGRYWLEPGIESDYWESIYWETSSTGSNGLYFQLSDDDGNNWETVYYQNAIFFVAGECEDVVEPQGPGCLTAIYGQYPNYTIVPGCFGQPMFIDNTYYGTYSKIHVTEGTEYTFLSTYSTDYITISDENGTTVLEAGFASVTWTATFTGVIRFYTHLDDQCNGNGSYVPRYIQCGEPIVIDTPDFPCYQGDGLASNSYETGWSINNGTIGADDFIVEPGKLFHVQQVRLNVFANKLLTTSTLRFREDNNGRPGEVIYSVTMDPTSIRGIGQNFGYLIQELTFDLPNTLDFTEGRYWLEPGIESNYSETVYWETTSTGTNGLNFQLSDDGGNNWSAVDDQNAIFFVAGECEDVVEPQDPGCLDAYYGQYPFTIFTPSCIGTPESITDEVGYYGEYSSVNVVAGTEYIFSTDDSSAYITISNGAGTTVYAVGTGSLTWIATANEAVRMYTHLNDSCDYSDDFVDRLVQCGEIVPPPANDDCANAIAVACGETVTGSTALATNSGGHSSPDVFYKFTGNGTPQIVTVSLCNSSFDTYVIIYSDCSLNNIIETDDDGCGTTRSQVSFMSDGTSTYYIMVEGYGTFSGAYEMSINCQDVPIVEAPDFPCYQGDGLASNGFIDGMYTNYGYLAMDDFIVEPGKIFNVQQVRMNVFSNSNITNAILYFRADDNNAPGAILETIQLAPTSSRIVGVNYGYNIYEVTFDLPTSLEFTEGRYWLNPNVHNELEDYVFWEVTDAGSNGLNPLASYDNGQSWEIWTDYQAVFFVSGECEDVVEPQDPGCLDAYYGQYPSTTFTPSCIGIPQSITNGVGYYGEYSRVNVVAGTEYIFSTDDSSAYITISNGTGTTVYAVGTGSVTWTATANETVRMNTHLNDSCDYSADFVDRLVQCGEIVPPPANDDCANAIAVACGETVTGSTVLATNSGGNTAPDVFYSFTGSGSPQTVTVSLCNSSYDTYVRIYTDCSLTTQIAQDDDGCGSSRSIVSFESDGTSTYYIMVEGYGNNSGAYEMNISCQDPVVFDDPDFDCFQGDGSISAIEDGYGIQESNIYRIAEDFVVAPGTEFTLRQVTMSLLSTTGVTQAKFRIHEDNAGLPGDIIETIDVAPSYNEIYGTAFGFNAHRVEFTLATPIVLGEGTYWLDVTTPNNTYWVNTTNGSDGSFPALSNTSGASWMPETDGFRMVFYVEGDCDTVTEPEDGCLEAENGAYPTTTFTPSCSGSPEVITSLAWTGEYSIVSVTAGTEYTFSSSIPTDFITISNETGTTVYAAGTGSITWTATASEIVRFYLHLDSDCNWAASGLRSRIVQCGDILPPPPNDDCANAIEVSCGDSVSGDTTFANNSGGNAAGDVFYKYTGDGTPQYVTASLCGSSYDTYIRIFTDCTLSNEVAFNDDFCGLQSEVTFLSDGTSTYYILVEGFSSNVGAFVLNISCNDVPPPPSSCEDMEVLSNNLENGLFFGGDTAQRLAVDVPVGDAGFTVYGMEPTVVGAATSFSFIFYENAGGVPGAQIATRTGSILGSEVTGNNFGYDFIKYSVGFNDPIDFEAHTTYWIEVVSDAVAWESTSAFGSMLGNGDVFWNTNVSGWSSTGGDEFVFNLICQPLSVGGIDNYEFSYYPNPARDVLYIKSSTEIQSVDVFNLVGQHMLNYKKVVNGVVNVSTLSPGSYVFKVKLKGGQTETFKILVK